MAQLWPAADVTPRCTMFDLLDDPDRPSDEHKKFQWKPSAECPPNLAAFHGRKEIVVGIGADLHAGVVGTLDVWVDVTLRPAPQSSARPARPGCAGSSP